MAILRVKFIRGEEVKFVSHLDLMMVFERAVRRSGLPISYSGGFNPHQSLVFGLPLSVGVTSESEYADMEFTEDISIPVFIEKFNSQLPKGIKVVSAVNKTIKTNIMSEITAAEYFVGIKADGFNFETLCDIKNKTLKAENLVLPKRTKSGIKDVDIRPMMYEIVPCEYNGILGFSMLISAGSKANLKPDLVIEGINKLTGSLLKICLIHRLKLFSGEKTNLKDPIEM